MKFGIKKVCLGTQRTNENLYIFIKKTLQTHTEQTYENIN